MISEIKRIFDAIEAKADHLGQTLCDLIAFPSIVRSDPENAGPGERDCQHYLQNRLNALGFTTDLWEPDGPDLYRRYKGRPGANKGRTFVGRPNLGGIKQGKGGGRSLMFTGHIDVVPPGPREAWNSDPFTPQWRDGVIQGRGAVDMKGGVAAMLIAAETVIELGLPLAGDIVFTTVVDEEIGGMGALAMADRGFRADAAILTEPTANRIAPMCRGVLWGRVIIEGIGGHAELEPKAWHKGGPVDAIGLCRQVLDGFDILNRRWALEPGKRHPLMSIPNQIVPTLIKAGEHPASMAGRAEITIDVQYLPNERDEFGLGGHVKREVEAHLAGIAAADPYLAKHPPRIGWFLDADCAEVPPDHPILPVISASAEAAGLPSALVGFGAHSDLGIPTNAGTPTLNFGPGDPTLAHQPNERIPLAELVACAKVLATTLRNWCA